MKSAKVNPVYDVSGGGGGGATVCSWCEKGGRGGSAIVCCWAGLACCWGHDGIGGGGAAKEKGANDSTLRGDKLAVHELPTRLKPQLIQGIVVSCPCLCCHTSFFDCTCM